MTTATDTRLAAGFKAATAGLKAIEDDLRARADDIAKMISMLEKHWIDFSNPTSLSELLGTIGAPEKLEADKTKIFQWHSGTWPPMASKGEQPL